MLETCNGACLLDKLVAIYIHQLGTTLRAERYATRVVVAIVVVKWEELLDTHQLIQHMMLSKIGDTKATATNSIANFVFTTLKDGSWFKFHSLGLCVYFKAKIINFPLIANRFGGIKVIFRRLANVGKEGQKGKSRYNTQQKMPPRLTAFLLAAVDVCLIIEMIT